MIGSHSFLNAVPHESSIGYTVIVGSGFANGLMTRQVLTQFMPIEDGSKQIRNFCASSASMEDMKVSPARSRKRLA